LDHLVTPHIFFHFRAGDVDDAGVLSHHLVMADAVIKCRPKVIAMNHHQFRQFRHEIDDVQGRKPLRVEGDGIFDLQSIGNLVSHMYNGNMKPTFPS
jgi:hypothetical protein